VPGSRRRGQVDEEAAGQGQDRGVDFPLPCADVGRGGLGMRGDCAGASTIGEGRSALAAATGQVRARVAGVRGGP
jgi:hypothetical protein